MLLRSSAHEVGILVDVRVGNFMIVQMLQDRWRKVHGRTYHAIHPGALPCSVQLVERGLRTAPASLDTEITQPRKSTFWPQ